MDYTKLEAMGERAFRNLVAKLDAKDSEFNAKLIAAGHGDKTSTQLHQERNDVSRRADPLLVAWSAHDLDRRDIHREANRRMEWHGSWKPIQH